ncbi:hypothetical protein CYMTET_40236 [Cymbomonas tetramitiformis]|uniref:Chromo domain-containing protein n=1 Tax=Cymbomonas tetramitiformis TaxID=36881 RepID=A0AAE0C8I2_9CHLO|nr:hypothetical protein CYMTET_40236 [Cymbomonas tetramitiformis]
MLRSFVGSNPEDWDQWCTNVEFAINDTRSDVTGFTPFELVLGHSPMSQLDLFLQAAKGDSPQRKGGEGSAHEMASRFSAQLADARVKLELAQQRQRTQFDQRHSQQSFQVGDRVWVEAKHLTENIMDRESYRKLSPRWHGPLVVIEQFFSDQQRDLPELDRGAPVAYRLKLPPKWRIHDVFAQHRLKACTTAEEAFARRREVPTPAKVMVDGQAQTHVDRILARRVRTTKAGKKIEEFQVRWTGYSKAHDEWKTRADLNFGGPLEQLLVFENERLTQEGRAKEKALHDARSQRLARRQQKAALNAMEVDESNPDYLLRSAEVVTVDSEDKWDPTFVSDVRDWEFRKFRPGFFDVIWASPPCTEYSQAKTTGVRQLREADACVRRTLQILDYLKPKHWFLENPMGSIRQPRSWGLIRINLALDHQSPCTPYRLNYFVNYLGIYSQIAAPPLHALIKSEPVFLACRLMILNNMRGAQG